MTTWLATEKIKRFHRRLFAVESPQCSVFLECFPTVETDHENVCTCCRADIKTPKTCSAENNMDPGKADYKLRLNWWYIMELDYLFWNHEFQQRGSFHIHLATHYSDI